MADFILLMHDDAPDLPGREAWGPYLGELQAKGRLQGGSAIGPGLCARKGGPPPPVTGHLTGFIRVAAADLEDARALLSGNPVFEAGGTVEIRELPYTD
jgi:hypothetical protein